MHDRLKERGQEITDEIEAIWKSVDDEDRQLSRRERARVEELIERAKSLKEQRQADAEIREVLGGGEQRVTRMDPKATVGEGWSEVAEAIASKRQRHVEIGTESLLRSKAAPARTKDLTGTDLDLGTGMDLPTFSTIGFDQRYLYSRLPIKTVSTELSVSDFRQTGSREVTGSVLRGLTATSTKAELDVSVEYFTAPMQQVAITIGGLPNALVQGVAALRVFLQVEAQYQLGTAIDNYVVPALEASDHLVGATGTGPIEQLRHAIADHREAGYNPSLAAVSPSTAAELDLTAFDSGYQFNTAAYGSSSPLGSMQVAEVPRVTDPLLVDTLAVGTLCLGPTKVDVDESAGFSENVSVMRCEASVLLIVRQAEAIWEVATAS